MFGLAAGAVIPTTLMFGVLAFQQRSGKSDVLDVAALQVRDSEGRVRVRLGTSPDNKSPGLFLYSEAGKVVGQFLVSDGNKPELHLSDDSFGWRASLYVAGPHGDPRLVFWGNGGSKALPVAAIGAGEPPPWLTAGSEMVDSSGYISVRTRSGESVLQKP